jgi:hypothetical protein
VSVLLSPVAEGVNQTGHHSLSAAASNGNRFFVLADPSSVTPHKALAIKAVCGTLIHMKDVNPHLLNYDPLPEHPEKLVSSDGNGSYLVQIGAGVDWQTYVSAYKMAADMLVERTHEGRQINWLIFPIWYLDRHHLELNLKSLIWDSDALAGVPKRRLRGHELMPLWGHCLKEIDKWQKPFPKEQLDAVAATLQQFDKIDPNSEAARYATSTKDAPSGLLGKEINVKSFVETTKKTLTFLSAVSEGFSQLQCSSLDDASV